MRLARAACAAFTVGAFLLLSGSAVSAQEGDRDCPDFASQAEAQAVLDADPSDPNRLDANDNGEACENQDYSGSGGSDASTQAPDPVSPPPTVTPEQPSVTPEQPSVTTGSQPSVTPGSSSGAMPVGGVATGFGGTADDGPETAPWPTWALGVGILLTALGLTQEWRSRRG